MKSDLTSNLLLATLSLKDQFFDTGATYRPTDESFNLACQYWQPPKLTYMNSGLNKYVTGVGVKLWDSSEACGQCLEVINGNKSVIVVIADYCPPPCTPMQLDLNPYASAALIYTKLNLVIILN